MRRGILTHWTHFCSLYVCSCGKPISGCREHKGSGASSIIVKEGCHYCFDRWMKKRIEKACYDGFTRQMARDLAMAS